MANLVLRSLFDANMLKYHLKQINTEDIVNDVFLRLFLINDIDTNFISIFVPEILENVESPYVERDARGRKRRDKTYPCEIIINFYEDAPRISIKEKFLQLHAIVLFNI